MSDVQLVKSFCRYSEISKRSITEMYYVLGQEFKTSTVSILNKRALIK